MTAATCVPAVFATGRSPRYRHLIITGANGYIGRRLVELALADGRSITILGRSNPFSPSSVRFANWELGAGLPVLEDAERTALVHLAHDWSDRNVGGINQRGTELLLALAREAGISRFVFVSSVSARSEALNAYGRIKWAIEQRLQGPDTVVARVGLVYGGPARGMYGLLLKLISSTPILPMVEPSRAVMPIHIDEVCRGLFGLVDGDATGPKVLAAREPISFAEFLKTLSREGFAASLRVPAVPLQLALAGASFARRIPFGPKVDKERILGLASTQLIDSGDDLDALGLELRPMAFHLRRSSLGNRALLREGRVLCRYVRGGEVPGTVIRRYVRAIRVTDPQAGPLALPRLVLAAPPFLRAYEPLRSDLPLTRRLRVATALVEWAPAEIGARSTKADFVGGLWQAILEILVFPLRWWLGR